MKDEDLLHAKTLKKSQQLIDSFLGSSYHLSNYYRVNDKEAKSFLMNSIAKANKHGL